MIQWDTMAETSGTPKPTTAESETGGNLRPAYGYAPTRSLSARLLILTAVFVMIAEVMIYAPSIGRFRISYLEDTIARAYLSMVAVERAGDPAVLDDLKEELLYQTDTYGISIKRDDSRSLMVGHDMPPEVNTTVDLREFGFFSAIMDAFTTLSQGENRVLRVVGMAPKSHDVMVEVIVDETPMRRRMIDYSTRILQLSIVISLFTACLVFFTLQWLIVRPLRRMTRQIGRFREHPEAATATPVVDRSDEIGVAERELLVMQDELRMALRQKTRLAALGAAMTKVNHDLRNTLATAVLASDALAAIKDPEVQRVTPRLMKAVDRAVRLCSQTLNFAREVEPPFRPSRFELRTMIDDVFQAVQGAGFDDFGDPLPEDPSRPAFTPVNDVPAGFMMTADRDQVIRAVQNLVDNAGQVGATRVAVSARETGECVRILVADDGPGVPEDARRHLFEPFAGSAREGGTGLGLVIVKDVAQAHRGFVSLIETGPKGTTFELGLPHRRAD